MVGRRQERIVLNQFTRNTLLRSFLILHLIESRAQLVKGSNRQLTLTHLLCAEICRNFLWIGKAYRFRFQFECSWTCSEVLGTRTSMSRTLRWQAKVFHKLFDKQSIYFNSICNNFLCQRGCQLLKQCPVENICFLIKNLLPLRSRKSSKCPLRTTSIKTKLH